MINDNEILSFIKNITKNKLIKDIVKYDKLKIIDKITDEKIIKNVINSTNENQKICKKWLIEKTKKYIENYNNPKICVAAGWYGHLSNMLLPYTDKTIISFDLDDECKTIGEKLYKNKNIKFITSDIKNYNCNDFDIVICTSCEHIEQNVINNFLYNRKKESLVILQSNNYYEITEHINCKKTLKDFVKDYDKNTICYYNELKLEKYNRYMIVFK